MPRPARWPVRIKSEFIPYVSGLLPRPTRLRGDVAGVQPPASARANSAATPAPNVGADDTSRVASPCSRSPGVADHPDKRGLPPAGAEPLGAGDVLDGHAAARSGQPHWRAAAPGRVAIMHRPGWWAFTGGTASVVRLVVGPRAGNRTRRSGGASCCHSQVSATGREADQALAVSPALSLMKGPCWMRSSAAANMVAGL